MNLHQISTIYQHTTAVDIPTESQLQHYICVTLQTENNTNNINLVTVDIEVSQQLNFQYRGKNSPTNVLSFQNQPFEGLSTDDELLGELVFCPKVIFNEAQQQHKTLISHWAHMCVHGCLHLLGYDHETCQQATVMETKEIHYLAQLGFNNPYEINYVPI